MPSPPATGKRQPSQNTHTRLPANHFTRSRITSNRDGILTFAVKLPGPGAIDVLATAWNDNLAQAAILLHPAPRRFVHARSHKLARHATELRFHVRPDARGRRLVRHHTYPVTLRLWISYTPKGGRPRSVGVFGLHLPRPTGSGPDRQRRERPARGGFALPLEALANLGSL